MPDRKSGKERKLPLQVTGEAASSDKPETWCSLELAQAAARKLRADGIGAVFDGDGFGGIDLDACRDLQTGAIAAWAQEVIDDFASYAEISPSGTGVKIYAADAPAALPANKISIVNGGGTGEHKPQIEAYVTRRYFAITGRHLPGTPDEIRSNPGAWERLAARLARSGDGHARAGNGSATPDAPEIVQALLAADPRLAAAWVSGAKLTPGKDASASGLDFSLAIHLAGKGHDDAAIEAALRAYPHGQIGGGKLGDREAERRIKSLLQEAARARSEKRADLAQDANPQAGDALLDTSHDGLALAMGREWQDTRHVALWGKWLFWSGARWEPDERLVHMTRTRDFLRRKGEELVRWARREVEAGKKGGGLVEDCERTAKALRSAQMVANVVGLARSNETQAASVGQWDQDPWLLGTPGGTVDLRTGALHPADPADYITKLTAIAPAPAGTAAPLWQAFLERIFHHDPELAPYMQRVAGYALTGLVSEHALIFAWGQGGNGKGVFFNTLAHVLADYAAVAAPDLLLVTQSDRHPADMAMLRGARLVIASEVAPGRAWDEPKLKSLTGGDPITARFMRQDFFTFTPQFTLLVAGNHKPSFKSVDEATRRRVQLVPFLQNIPKAERDPNLGEKLKAEAPAILRWAIEGCLAWQEQGLNPPKAVREASESYLEGEDTLGQWIDERCEVGGFDLTPLDTLFQDWRTWCEANGGPGWGGKTFAKALDERGFRRDKSNGVRGFRNIKLRPKETAQAFKDAAEPGWEVEL